MTGNNRILNYELLNTRWCFLLGISMLLTVSVVDTSHAQGSPLKIGMGKSTNKNDKKEGIFWMFISVSPEQIVISEDSKEITVKFTNATRDTIKSAIRLYNTLPPEYIIITEGQQDEKKTSSFILKEADRSLTSWLKGIPDSITLPPNSTKSMTFKLDVPSETGNSSYTGWIAALSEIELPPRAPKTESTRVAIISKIKIVYEKKAMSVK